MFPVGSSLHLEIINTLGEINKLEENERTRNLESNRELYEKCLSIILKHTREALKYPNAFDSVINVFEKTPLHDETTRKIVEASLVLRPQQSFKEEKSSILHTLKKQSLQSQINANTFGHLLGDEFIRGMTDVEGKAIEGSKFSSSMPFLKSLIKYLKDTYPEEFTSQTNQVFSQLDEQLAWSAHLSEEIEDAIALDTDKQIGDRIDQISEEVLHKLEALQTGENLLIPWGWRDRTGGHAMLIECRCDAPGRLTLNVYNTGEGTQYHELETTSGKIYVNTVSTYSISLHDIRNKKLINALLEPQVIKSLKHFAFDYEYNAESLYALIDPYKVRSSGLGHTEFWARPQFSGTCSMRCLLAFIGNQIDRNDYRKFKRLGSVEMIDLAVNEAQANKNASKTLIELIAKVSPNAFRKVGKEMRKSPLKSEEEFKAREKLVSKMDASAKRAEQLISTPKPANPALSTDPASFVPMTDQVNKEIAASFAAPVGRIMLQPNMIDYPQPSPKLDLEKITKARELLQAVQELNKYCVSAKGLTSTSCMLSKVLLSFVKLMNNDPKTDETSQLLNDLQKNPDVCLALMKEVKMASSLLFEDASKSKNSLLLPIPEVQLTTAILGAFCVCMGLAQLIEIDQPGPPETKLGYFSLPDNPRYLAVLAKESHGAFLNNEKQEEDWQLVKQLYAKMNRGAGPALFDFPKFITTKAGRLWMEKTEYSMQFTKERGDCMYAQARSQLAEENKEADEAYNKAMEKFPGSKAVDRRLWNAAWCYLNEMPEHFSIVRDLAVLAYVVQPDTPREHLNMQDLQFTGPDLELIPEEEHTIEKPLRIIFSVDKKKIENGFTTALGHLPGNNIQPLFDPEHKLEVHYHSEGNADWKDFSEYGLNKASPFLEPSDQNELMKILPQKFHDLMAIRSAVHDDIKTERLFYQMLIDYFETEYDNLTHEKQIIFLRTFLTPSPYSLKDEIKVNPSLGDEFESFFEKLRSKYQDNLDANIDLSQSLEGIGFVLTNKLRLLTMSRTLATEEKNAERVNELNDKIAKARASILSYFNQTYPEERSERKFKLHLLIGLIESYSKEKRLSFSDCSNLLKASSWIGQNIQKAEGGGYVEPVKYAFLYDQIQAILTDHAHEIQRNLEEKPNETEDLFNELLKNLGVSNPGKKPWMSIGFPFYRLETDEDNHYVLDILSSTISWNGIKIVKGGYLEHSSIFQPVVKLQNQGDYYAGTDQKGDFAYKETGGPHVQRKIQGMWYALQLPKNQSAQDLFKRLSALPHFDPEENCTIWRSLDEKNNPHFLVCDKNLSIKYKVLENGHFEIDSTGKIYEWIDPVQNHSGKGVAAFNAQCNLWRKDDGSEFLLEFPNTRDESGNSLVFERKQVEFPDHHFETRWVWKNQPHLFLSNEQMCQGIRDFHNFLVLENTRGDKEMLVPAIPYSKLKRTDIPDKPIPCIRMPLRDGVPLSQSPEKNAFLAYLTLAYAKFPEDYELAMSYLKKAYRYEGYSDEEFRVLGWIFKLVDENHDNNPNAEAIRLYSYWLARDNLKRTPPKTKPYQADTAPNLMALPLAWKKYWTGECEWSKDNQIKNFKTDFYALADRYLARRNIVQANLRLENILDEREIHDMELDIYESGKPRGLIKPYGAVFPSKLPEITHFHFKPLLIKILVHPDALSPEDRKLREEALSDPLFRTQGRMSLQWKSYDLCKVAMGNNAQQKAELAEWLIQQKQDTSKENYVVRLILEILLNPVTENEKKVYEFMAGLQSKTTEEEIGRAGFDTLTTLLKNVHLERSEALIKLTQEKAKDNLTLPSIKLAGPAIISPDALTAPLPALPGKEAPLLFNPAENNKFSDLYQRFFKSMPPEAKSLVMEPFTYKSAESFIQGSIDALNSDYSAGAHKNQNVLRHEMREGFHLSELESLLSGPDGELERMLKNLTEIETSMLELANKLPSDREKSIFERIDRLARQKNVFKKEDLIALFLQQREAAYSPLTNLNAEEINALHKMIGDYLILATDIQKAHRVLGGIKEAAQSKSDEERQIAIQGIAEELSRKRNIDFSRDPAAFLVFEYYLDLTLKEDQLNGLRQMGPDPSGNFPQVLIQRIQGGGKTLVWGHLLALMKADGFHLSVHVPPTAQYKTALYDMSHLSGRIFGQKERTIIFDDNPLHFTDGYLDWINDTLTRAVQNREYVTMTKETLWSLQDKYFKLRAEQDKGPQNEKTELLIQKLKSILKLLQGRGVFTLDEVHQTLDPRKELNMPIGAVVHPDRIQTSLIGKIYHWALQAKDSHHNKLLRLKENEQSQQTQDQYAEMQKQIIERMFADPFIQTHFALISSLNIQEVIDYVSGKTGILPDYLKKIKEESERKAIAQGFPELSAADHVILAREMVTGWLKERLEKSVNEHMGFSKRADVLPIAIPYISNMNPIEGSEFSDRYVMICNTFMTYFVNGLTEEQTGDFIAMCRERAYLEKELASDDRKLSLRDTGMARRFESLFNINLFDVDLQSREMVHRIKEGFKSDETSELLIDYLTSKVFPHVELFDLQVSCHGQNLAAMPKTFNGYSGSFDNPYIAPVGTNVLLDKGTNGQTIDLLVRKNNDIWVVRAEDKANTDAATVLLEDILQKHPKKGNIRAIIDAGCQFRGFTNEAVARKIVRNLAETKSDLAGVLFFDESGRLQFMSKEDPLHPISLSGTRPETILLETGLPPEKLFTYYDQDHITGIDISQAGRASAVLTVSEHTMIHEILQGSRRLRKLDKSQRLIFAVQQGSLDKIGAKLNEAALQKEAIGKASALNIRHLLLFAHINEVEIQKKDNLVLAMQKMETLVQKYMLQKMYQSDPVKEAELFRASRHLFVKNIFVDLYKEYAYKKASLSAIDFLNLLKIRLLDPLRTILTEEELKSLTQQIEQEIISPSKDTLPPTIEVSEEFQKSRTVPQNPNQEGVMVRTTQAQKTTASEKKKIGLNLAVQKTYNQIEQSFLKDESIAKEVPFEESSFPKDFNLFKAAFKGPGIFPLNVAIKNDELVFGYPEFSKILDDNIYVTSNFAAAFEDRTNLLGIFRKRPYQCLLVYDENESPQWKVILGTVRDAAFFKKMLQKQDAAQHIPPTRKVWLVRPKGASAAAGPFPFDRSVSAMPEVNRLLAQILYFSGDLPRLNEAHWAESVKAWLGDKPSKELARKFFMEQILRNPPEDYNKTRIAQAFS